MKNCKNKSLFRKYSYILWWSSRKKMTVNHETIITIIVPEFKWTHLTTEIDRHLPQNLHQHMMKLGKMKMLPSKNAYSRYQEKTDVPAKKIKSLNKSYHIRGGIIWRARRKCLELAEKCLLAITLSYEVRKTFFRSWKMCAKTYAQPYDINNVRSTMTSQTNLVLKIALQ